MDRFKKIKDGWECEKRFGSASDLYVKNIEWLITEVERMRKIEDAAANWIGSGFLPEGAYDFHEAFVNNPRPEE